MPTRRFRNEPLVLAGAREPDFTTTVRTRKGDARGAVDLLFTEVVDGSPVRLWHSKPLAVSRPDVDVDRTEVVVLLVA